MKVEMTVDMMTLAKSADPIVLFSGDGDLRRQADDVVDLSDLAGIVGRPRRDQGQAMPRFFQGDAGNE
jgi:uncharacterized LabA/DUF88 family protein